MLDEETTEEESALELPGLTDDDIAALKEEHGELEAIPLKLGTLVFRTPKKDVYFRLLNKLAQQKNQAEAMHEFALSCVVWPQDSNGKPDFSIARQTFAAKPGLVLTITGKLQELAGASDTVESKKL